MSLRGSELLLHLKDALLGVLALLSQFDSFDVVEADLLGQLMRPLLHQSALLLMELLSLLCESLLLMHLRGAGLLLFQSD